MRVKQVLLAGIALVFLSVSAAGATGNSNNNHNHNNVDGGDANVYAPDYSYESDYNPSSSNSSVYAPDYSRDYNSNYAGGGQGGDGGNANSGAYSGSSSGVYGSGNSESASSVRGSGNSDVDTDVRTHVGTYQGQDQSQGQIGIQGQHARTGSQDVSINSDDDTTIITINPVALSNLPAAVCQGPSQSGSAGGGTPALGLSLGFGNSEESWDCNVRENIKVIAAMASSGAFSKTEIMELRDAAIRAMATTSGFEGLSLEPRSSFKEDAKVSQVSTKVTAVQDTFGHNRRDR